MTGQNEEVFDWITELKLIVIGKVSIAHMSDCLSLTWTM